MRNISREGVTVTEIVVVMVLISVLVALSVPYLADIPAKAREARIQRDLNTLRQLVQEYTMDTRMTRGFRVGLDPFFNADGAFISWELMEEYNYIDSELLYEVRKGPDRTGLYPLDPYGRLYSIIIQRYVKTPGDGKIWPYSMNLYWLATLITGPDQPQQAYSILVGRGEITDHAIEDD